MTDILLKAEYDKILEQLDNLKNRILDIHFFFWEGVELSEKDRKMTEGYRKHAMERFEEFVRKNEIIGFSDTLNGVWMLVDDEPQYLVPYNWKKQVSAITEKLRPSELRRAIVIWLSRYQEIEYQFATFKEMRRPRNPMREFEFSHKVRFELPNARPLKNRYRELQFECVDAALGLLSVLVEKDLEQSTKTELLRYITTISSAGREGAAYSSGPKRVAQVLNALPHIPIKDELVTPLAAPASKPGRKPGQAKAKPQCQDTIWPRAWGNRKPMKEFAEHLARVYGCSKRTVQYWLGAKTKYSRGVHCKEGNDYSKNLVLARLNALQLIKSADK
ncbi:MAG TPA: hypothetical protein VKX17_14185 [Planctomycetota bacterium]|nr:hypothetical protein [Planctomycetota bacterium]